MNRFLWVWECVSKLQALLFQKQVFSQVQVASLLPHDRWTDMAQATRLLATKETLQAASMCDSGLHGGKSSDSGTPGLHKFHDVHCCMLGRSVALGLALKATVRFDGCRLPSIAEMDMKQCIQCIKSHPKAQVACRVPELEFLRPSTIAHVDLDLDEIAAGVWLVRSNAPRLVQQCRFAGQTMKETKT
jgi:hypothetical protein